MEFSIRDKFDFLEAATLVAQNKLDIDAIVFPDKIVETIKIQVNGWNNAIELDYRIASLMIALQKDIIGIYNHTCNKKITLNNIDNAQFIQLKFVIKESSIELDKILNGEYLKQMLTVVRTMTRKEKFTIAVLAFLGLGVYRSPDIIAAINSNKELAEAAEKPEVKIVVAENQRGPGVLLNNIGSGTVIINGVPVSADGLKRSMGEKPEKQDPAPIEVSDSFTIHTYDFIKQEVKLVHPCAKFFWASAEWLSKDKRDKLKALASKGVDNQNEFVTLSAKFVDGEVVKAIILGVGEGGTSTGCRMGDALATSQEDAPAQPQQLPLFPDG